MELTGENYYSGKANREYMSVSQYKDFAGTIGMGCCEYGAMEKLEGRWSKEMTTPMLIGSYVDRYFEGTLEDFKSENPQIFTQKGDLRAEYRKADKIIERIERDPLFMAAMSGEKQAIMTGELFGAKWKIKMDSYSPGESIVDLKVVKAVHGKDAFEWVRDYGYSYFALVWGYDIQGAIYQEIVRQNTGERLPFYLACATKQDEPDIELIEITQDYLDFALETVRRNMPRVLAVKSKAEKPMRCGRCECCRRNKVLRSPITIPEFEDAF